MSRNLLNVRFTGKSPPCPSKSLPSINSCRCRISGPCASRCALCDDLWVKGTILLAHEGINGTIAGSDDAIDVLTEELRDGPLFGGRLDNLELKYSTAPVMPFRRMKVRLKKEIVTLGDGAADPTKAVGVCVDAADWNALRADEDTLVIDTRNAFEVEMGGSLEKVPEADSRWQANASCSTSGWRWGRPDREAAVRRQRLRAPRHCRT